MISSFKQLKSIVCKIYKFIMMFWKTTKLYILTFNIRVTKFLPKSLGIMCLEGLGLSHCHSPTRPLIYENMQLTWICAPKVYYIEGLETGPLFTH